MKTLINKNGWVVRASEELAPRMIAKGYQYCPKSKWKKVSGLTPRAADGEQPVRLNYTINDDDVKRTEELFLPHR